MNMHLPKPIVRSTLANRYFFATGCDFLKCTECLETKRVADKHEWSECPFVCDTCLETWPTDKPLPSFVAFRGEKPAPKPCVKCCVNAAEEGTDYCSGCAWENSFQRDAPRATAL